MIPKNPYVLGINVGVKKHFLNGKGNWADTGALSEGPRFLRAGNGYLHTSTASPRRNTDEDLGHRKVEVKCA